jgi:predicted nucleotidyltransferase
MDALLQKLRESLAARGDVVFAVLFGSGARGELKPSSDLDLALRLDPSPDAWELGGLVADLMKAMGRRVDVVLLPQVRSALLRHEISKGLLLLGDRDEWIEFRQQAMREWRDFEPRFRRYTEAGLRKFLREQGAHLGQGR